MCFEQRIKEYLSIAKRLSQQCNCVLMGSLALYLEYPQVLKNFPGDVDMMTSADEANLKNIIRVLKAGGFKLLSWQDEIDETVSYELLKGRYYIRGLKEIDKQSITVDITYESDVAEWQQVKDCYVENQDIKVFTKDVLITFLENSEREKNQEQARLLRQI